MENRSHEKRTVPLYFLKKPFDKSTRILCAKDRIDRAKEGILIVSLTHLLSHSFYCIYITVILCYLLKSMITYCVYVL